MISEHLEIGILTFPLFSSAHVCVERYEDFSRTSRTRIGTAEGIQSTPTCAPTKNHTIPGIPTVGSLTVVIALH